MKKKNGFISMSIIYSFFTVFILVSTSLLLIYSNNLSIVKNVNKDIKEDLTKKGNNSLMIFKNLIQDGSFENPSENWEYETTLQAPVFDEQRYYGNNSLGLIKDTDSISLVKSKYTIRMTKGHYYYISRIYLAYNNIKPQDNVLILKLKQTNDFDYTNESDFNIMTNAFGLMKKAGDQCLDITTDTDCLFNNRSINQERIRYQSGFCLKVNGRCDDTMGESNEDSAQTLANTFESGVFEFTNDTGDYRLLIGSNFTSFTDGESGSGILPRYYTDGYMLIDLTVALNLDKVESDEIFLKNDAIVNKRRVAEKIDNLLDGRFIENQKTIPVNKLNLN